ncbi:MAG: biotin--[acetyl-CoA-carboxylase] ligase [Cyanobacteria bacterium J06559_1]
MDILKNGIPLKPKPKIDIQKIQRAIAADGAHLGICPAFSTIRSQFDIHAFDTLPSTNTHLWSLLKAGAHAGTVVVATQQTAGRGQRQRQWISETGGLYLSLALEPNWPVSQSALLTCLSAWGIATAFNNIGIRVEIKWPNDLFYKGKKLGGILTETKLSQISSTGAGSPSTLDNEGSKVLIRQAVIGVGINWHNSPPDNGINLAKILEAEVTQGKVDKNKINCLEVLIALVLRGIMQGYLFQQQVSGQDFMKAYQKLLTQVGRSVSLGTDGLLSLAAPVPCHSSNQYSLNKGPLNKGALNKGESWRNRSGEIIGVSERGYLQVAMHNQLPPSGSQSSDSQPFAPHASRSTTNILLFKPSEIHIS